ncbi:putative NADH-flavin reductase [Bradyrhizobium liaoningense]
MKIAVAGASGRAGSEITRELSRRGHAVTAIARNPEKIAALPNVTPTKGDVLDQAGLAKLWAGHDVAVSSVHFLASDPLKLIGAAKDSKIGRYLVVGGAGSLEVAPGVKLVTTPNFPTEYKAEAEAGSALPRPAAAGKGPELDLHLAVGLVRRGGTHGQVPAWDRPASRRCEWKELDHLR